MTINSKYVVGLTGGIGSGKSTVARIFADLGVDVIDADMLSREVVEPGSEALAKIAGHFGEAILGPGGELNRPMLRETVFADTDQKDWLENLLHPLINQLMKTRLENSTSEYCVLESPLLLETNQHDMVNRILLVDVSERTQLARSVERDQGDPATIRAIIASQISRDQRRQKADDIIDNEPGMDQLLPRVTELHEHYNQLAKSL